MFALNNPCLWYIASWLHWLQLQMVMQSTKLVLDLTLYKQLNEHILITSPFVDKNSFVQEAIKLFERNAWMLKRTQALALCVLVYLISLRCSLMWKHTLGNVQLFYEFIETMIHLQCSTALSMVKNLLSVPKTISWVVSWHDANGSELCFFG